MLRNSEKFNDKMSLVDFGTTARPSNPQFVSRIDDALK